ncbi:C40 family peptidase, partial [Gordonia shandongensis]|uniref:C40 family peptidase n=1 Tax=Gordonia shandongensis TaxID=376351 RepID=UPI00047AC240
GTRTALTAAGDDAARSAAAARAGWHGVGGDAAAAAADRVGRADETVGESGADLAALIESAAGHVRAANTELNALVESFVAAASTVPAVTTPAGLAALVPLAADHIARGMQVIARARDELARDTAQLGRFQAPADTAPPGATALDGNSTAPGRIPITLPDGSVAYAPNQRAAKAVRAALSMRGTPYVWGGTEPGGFDCSGLTQWAYRQAGLEIPRLAQDQDTAGFQVSQADLQPGDLAVWSGHVAMYVGNDQMIEAGDPVQVNPVRTTNLDHTFEGFYRPR